MSLVPLALALLVPANAPASAAAPELAVVAIGSESEAPPVSLAQQLAQALEQRGRRTLAGPAVAQRLRNFTAANIQSLATVQAQVERARAAYAAFDLAQSAHLLEQAVQSLEVDSAPTPAKQELLQQARLQLADRLLALAGSGESGRAETAGGQRALVHLESALRADPLLAPPSGVYPPRLRQLLELARQNVRAAGTGSIAVRSTPSGAVVVLEGRVLGATPLLLERSVPRGRYRLWVELGGRRSRTRIIEVGEAMIAIDINLGFEGAIDATDGGLRALGAAPLSDADLIQTGDIIDADQLVATGFAEFENSRWIYAALYDIAGGSAMRRGAVRVTDGTDRAGREAAALASLADFLVASGNQGHGIATAPVPIRENASAAMTNAPATSQPASRPATAEAHWNWLLPAALASGAVVAVVAAIGVTLAIYAVVSAPTEPVRSLHIEVQR